MPRPPYMNFPFPFYRNYASIHNHYPNFPASNINNNTETINHKIVNRNSSKSANNDEFDRSFEEKNKSNKYTDDYLFDLFGLKIYSDDVLLVSLIYFLYSEGVKDDSLFLVLVLLLLS